MPRKSRNAIPAVRPLPPLREAFRITPPHQLEAELDDELDERGAYDDGKMVRFDDDDAQAYVRRAIDEARDYDESQMQPDRLKATEYYLGDMDRDTPPNPGGSTLVSFDVRDTVQAAMPSFLRVFFGPGSNILEFTATKAEEEEFARLATAYVGQLVRQRLGAVGLHAAIMDAMMARVGTVVWWWDEAKRVDVRKYTRLDDIAYAMATEQPDDKTEVEVLEEIPEEIPVPAHILVQYQQMTQAAMAQGIPPDQLPPPPQPQQVRNCTVRYTTTTKRLRIEPVPPEERLMDPKARSIEQARFCGRKMVKQVIELVAMGYERDVVLEHATVSDPYDQDEALRQPERVQEGDDDLPGEDYREVDYCELWARYDLDGDGVAELVKFCTIGETRHVVHAEPASQVQMAEFRLMPTPHSAGGDALAQNVFDIQRFKTVMLRGLSESLPHSIYPRLMGVEGKVNWQDALKLAPGQPIRIKELGALAPLTVPFMGEQLIGVMKWIDEDVRDSRTGLSKAARGLDPDALQSTTAGAANAIVGATQMQLEGYARMIAETGLRQLYRGILREVVENQREPEWMKINGKWVEVDPRSWNVDMEITVDPAPGTGDPTPKLAALGQVLGIQQGVLEKLGPQNPLVTIDNLYNTCAKIIELSGIARHANAYFTDPQGKPLPPPPKDGAEGDAAGQAALAQAELAKAKMDDDTERVKIRLQDDRERDKLEAEIVFKSLDLQGKYGIPVDPLAIVQALRMPRPPGTLPLEPNPHNPAPQGPGAMQQPPA